MTASHDDDEALARALQDQFQRESLSSFPATENAPSAPPVEEGIAYETAPPPDIDAEVLRSFESIRENERSFADEEYARKIDQELRDEQLARRITQEESRSTQATVIIPPDVEVPPQRRCTPKKIASWVCTLGMVTAAVVVVLMVFVGGSDDGDGIPSFPDFGDFWDDEDPFEDSAGANKWNTGANNGLELEIINALDSGWDNFFYDAVSDWENGDPDALMLSTSTAPYDYLCGAEDAKMKVCNGDYGATRWRGVNEVALTQAGYIVNSVAKMNDHYLNGASEAQKQYTMCHEIGHGFGLPHTDIVFDNENLGNCMDYTDKPETNKRPSEMNFNLLRDLYGVVSSRRNLALGPHAEEDGEVRPPLDLARYASAVEELLYAEMDDKPISSETNWRLLKKSRHGEVHMIDLDDHYKIVVRMLLA